jgi:nicotinamidase-related amidase
LTTWNRITTIGQREHSRENRVSALAVASNEAAAAKTRDDEEPMAGSDSEDSSPLAPGESDRALIVLDMTLDRFRGPEAIPAANGIVKFVQGELRYFRERARFIVFAHAPSSSVIQELTPRSDERVMKKPSPSAFYGTDLDVQLQKRRIRRLTLVGLETHTSVLLTAADAMARGYEIVVPDPCVAARDAEAHKAALQLLRVDWPLAWENARLTEPTQPGTAT